MYAAIRARMEANIPKVRVAVELASGLVHCSVPADTSMVDVLETDVVTLSGSFDRVQAW
jgi:hypothetical protein